MNPRRLLILDDDFEVGQTLQFIAAATGFEARHCSEPQRFFELVAEWQPSHIALDLIMPVMDGVEVLGQLSQLGSRARIILVSGMSGRVLEAARRSAVEHGLDIAGALPKPFPPARLRALLNSERPGTPPPATLNTLASAKLRAPAPVETLTAADVIEGIEQRQFTVAYQPKVSCKDGSLAGFEALARWHSPRLGQVAPDRFIAVAEQNDLIDEITLQILDQSLAWFARFDADGAHGAVSLAVNLSARSLDNPRLIDGVLEHCGRLGVDPARMVFELTETSAMSCPVGALDVLTRLRMKGFQLSLDDFGTGYSSMVQLVRLPFTEIKVDRSFVMAVASSAEARSVVRSIVDLGHSLGLDTTAEGVEDAETLQFLNEIGCDLAQGYYFSRPLAADSAYCWQPRTLARPVDVDRRAGARS